MAPLARLNVCRYAGTPPRNGPTSDSRERLLEVELGEADGAVPWPKLEAPAACGPCVHVGRCWRAELSADDEPAT